MRIIDELKNVGSPYEIPDAGRDHLPQFFVDMGYKTGVEVGVYKGEFSEKLCNAGLTVVGVDPYRVYKNYKKHPKEDDYEEMYENARMMLEENKGCLIRETSMGALNSIPDESLDFVYIDGNHSISYIVADIYEWSRKVKKGGCVSGHDYCLIGRNPYGLRTCHVKTGVDLMTKLLGVKNFYVLGKKHGERLDKWRSWLYIKE